MADQPNSASLSNAKWIYFWLFVTFWLSCIAIAEEIAHMVVHTPLEYNPNSAFVYILYGFVFLMVGRGNSRLFGSFAMIAATLSVIMLKWDGWIYHLFVSVSLMLMSASFVNGLVMPWHLVRALRDRGEPLPTRVP